MMGGGREGEDTLHDGGWEDTLHDEGVGGRERTPYMMGGGREGEDTLHDGGWEGGRGHPT